MKRSLTVSGPAKSRVTKTARVASKKNYRKKKTFNSFVNLGPQPGFPTRMMVRHRYVETVTLTSTTGAATIYSFRANGMYDPNVTGTGHQPMYFDQLSALYNHFCVVGSRIKCTFVPSSTSYPMLITLYLNDDASGQNPVYNAFEEMSGRGTLLGTSGSEPKVLNCSFSAKGTFGGSVVANTRLQGDATADPVEQSLFSIEAQTADLSNTTACVVLVEIEYISVWTELKDIASS